MKDKDDLIPVQRWWELVSLSIAMEIPVTLMSVPAWPVRR